MGRDTDGAKHPTKMENFQFCLALSLASFCVFASVDCTMGVQGSSVHKDDMTIPHFGIASWNADAV